MQATAKPPHQKTKHKKFITATGGGVIIPNYKGAQNSGADRINLGVTEMIFESSLNPSQTPVLSLTRPLAKSLIYSMATVCLL